MEKVKFEADVQTRIEVKLVDIGKDRERVEPVAIPDDHNFKRIGYGFQIMGFEGGYTVLTTGRQDGKTHITVLYTSIDGDTETVAQGLVKWKDEADYINKAFKKKEEEFLECRQGVMAHFKRKEVKKNIRRVHG